MQVQLCMQLKDSSLGFSILGAAEDSPDLRGLGRGSEGWVKTYR